MPKFTAAQRKAYAARRRNRRGRQAAQSKFKLRRPKNAVVKSIAPILETKKYLGLLAGSIPGPVTSYMSNTGPTHVYVPGSFTYMSQQQFQNSPAVEGNDVFSKYLEMKFRLTYPSNANAPPNIQVQPVEMIWGWCKPLNYTSLTTPKRENCSRQDIVNHVTHQIAEEFNEKLDNMKFNDRVKRNYNIIGRRKLVPNNNRDVFQNTWDIGAVQQQGGPTPIFRNVNWKMNKKVELTLSSDSTGTADPFLYPNQAYIPFVLLFNPSYAEYPTNVGEAITQIEVTRNSCHWFNDA